MKDFIFNTPTKVYFGQSFDSNLGEILASYKIKRILFHYGKSSIKKTGLYDKIISQLNSSNITYIELGGVEANPKLELVHQGVKLCKEHNLQLILAVGGGSVIDSAKSIAVGAKVDFDPWKFSIKEEIPKEALPVGIVLTLAAAGSEMSNSCVITNEGTKEKRGFNSELNRPLFAIMNPINTYTVSPYQTACGIVDILMHTLERFFADQTEESSLTDNLAIGLMKSVLKAGKIVIKDPTNYNARAELMWASSLSHNGLTGCGKAFQMSVHQIEHEISGMFDEVSHGAGLAVVWPAWAMLSYPQDIKHFEKFAYEIMEVANTNDIKKDIEKAILKLKNFFQEIGMPTSLQELNIQQTSIDDLAVNYSFNHTRIIHDIIDVDYAICKKILMNAK